MGVIPKILVADDEPAIRNVLCAYLSENGYEVSVASDASEAERILAQEPVTLLVSDIQMPGNHELEFIKNAVTRYPDLLVIVITAHPTLPTALRSLRLRVVDYVVKPFEMSDLLNTIASTLKKGQILDCVRRYRKDCEDLETRLGEIENGFSMRLNRSQEPNAGQTATQVMDLLFSQVVRSTLNLRLAFETLGKEAVERSPAVSGPFCRSIDCPVRLGHEETLREVIEVLEKTRNSFKSKELGELRKKVEKHLLKQATA